MTGDRVLRTSFIDIFVCSSVLVSVPVTQLILAHQPIAQALASYGGAAVVLWRIVLVLQRAFRAWRIARDAGKVIGRPLKRRNRR